MLGSEPAPSPPNVVSRASTSFQVFTGESCRVTHRLTSSVTLPIQVNLVLSNSALPSSGAMPWLREKVPMTEPSLGATE